MFDDLRFPIPVFTLGCLLAASMRVPAADRAAWRVWLEPGFMRPAIGKPFAGAQKTVLTGGLATPEGLAPFPRDTFSQRPGAWEAFEAIARENARADLARLTPRFERDRKEIILYAALEADEPIVASAVLAPGFLEMWAETMGEKVLVAVPNRQAAFIFPRIASEYLDYSPMVLRAYRETAWPVSLEVFEVSAAGWRAIGAYQAP
jgi:hypothetical protein